MIKYAICCAPILCFSCFIPEQPRSGIIVQKWKEPAKTFRDYEPKMEMDFEGNVHIRLVMVTRNIPKQFWISFKSEDSNGKECKRTVRVNNWVFVRAKIGDVFDMDTKDPLKNA